MQTRRALKKDREFWPPKYYRGLTLKQKIQRKKEIEKGLRLTYKNPKAYKVFKSNTFKKSKPSGYTQKWKSLFPNAKSLEEKSKASGVPLKYIKESYNRGLAAFVSGHRPGATQQQWGYARVSSFLLCGKTYFTADSDLARKAKAESASARRWWKSQKC